MPSAEEMDQIYRNARNALYNVSRSRKATPAQRRRARRARSELTTEYIRKVDARIKERTEQFARFVQSMSDLIIVIEDDDSPVNALETLKDIVSKAKTRFAGIKTEDSSIASDTAGDGTNNTGPRRTE